MSIFSDRRSLRQIGGFGAYLRQVTWSIGWRWRRRSDRASSGWRTVFAPSRASGSGG